MRDGASDRLNAFTRRVGHYMRENETPIMEMMKQAYRNIPSDAPTGPTGDRPESSDSPRSRRRVTREDIAAAREAARAFLERLLAEEAAMRDD